MSNFRSLSILQRRSIQIKSWSQLIGRSISWVSLLLTGWSRVWSVHPRRVAANMRHGPKLECTRNWYKRRGKERLTDHGRDHAQTTLMDMSRFCSGSFLFRGGPLPTFSPLVTIFQITTWVLPSPWSPCDSSWIRSSFPSLKSYSICTELTQSCSLLYTLLYACWICFSNWILSSLRIATCK